MSDTVDAQAARERAEQRLNIAVECDMYEDGRPCADCLAERELARDVLALATRLEAAETALRTIVGISGEGDLWYPSERAEEVEDAFAAAHAALAADRGEHG